VLNLDRRSRATGGLVAIKVIDTDKTDYEEMTTKNLQETLREINILQQVKVHNELWIVSEYASGGSVSTLMKPRLQTAKAGLEEKYIIPIARELAMGLKYIHEAGVIHRDLKCKW
jgi:serine/threonine protein kinase